MLKVVIGSTGIIVIAQFVVHFFILRAYGVLIDPDLFVGVLRQLLLLFQDFRQLIFVHVVQADGRVGMVCSQRFFSNGEGAFEIRSCFRQLPHCSQKCTHVI